MKTETKSKTTFVIRSEKELDNMLSRIRDVLKHKDRIVEIEIGSEVVRIAKDFSENLNTFIERTERKIEEIESKENKEEK